MTREQAEIEYRKLLNELVEEKEKIYEKAKADGLLKPGLDTNRDLYEEINKKYQAKIKALRESVDEE